MMLSLSLVPYVRNGKLVETDYNFLAERSKVKVTTGTLNFQISNRQMERLTDGWMDEQNWYYSIVLCMLTCDINQDLILIICQFNFSIHH